ncbi:MAG TPA: GH1 family beta-glucosidase [Thermoanaerobaculaceae bacterium]|nr:GH1 family beta-glucosidase [Thermoanaerobaculaceae bacterium]HRS15219.1 GH1 family beta-glucosidase [Thermoanaerobaculaceae bacterium]
MEDTASTASPGVGSGFPVGFLWGAATSAYQVEGSPLADGAGPSIWHRFALVPGRIRDGATGDVACDHYRRWREDLALMRELGLGAYRFSVAWGRVLPEGCGRVNPRGLDFYDRLVDGLLAAGIEPVLTLYHWDLPAALDDRGGWLASDIAGWFADYTTVVARALGDRVRWWATINEPWVVADGGYLHGVLAPGHASLREAEIAGHNLLRAHAAAVLAFRAVCRQRIGLVVNLEPKHPASASPQDLAATRRADAYMNRQYLDPALLGRYPEELAEVFEPGWPRWRPAEIADLAVPIDFLGVNYYTRGVMRYDPAAWPLNAARVRQEGAFHSATDWEVYPQGLLECLLWVHRRYGELPILVTENGLALTEPETVECELHDPDRIAFIREHLAAVREAIRLGVDVRGYLLWSLLDNLEWNQGFSKRFGIVHLDFATQRRTPKASARFFADIARSHGAALA